MDPSVKAKFLKIAGLLASPHDGEKLNALQLANNLLQKHKLTWRELLESTGGGPAAGPVQLVNEIVSLQRTLRARDAEILSLKHRLQVAETRSGDKHANELRQLLEECRVELTIAKAATRNALHERDIARDRLLLAEREVKRLEDRLLTMEDQLDAARRAIDNAGPCQWELKAKDEQLRAMQGEVWAQDAEVRHLQDLLAGLEARCRRLQDKLEVSAIVW